MNRFAHSASLTLLAVVITAGCASESEAPVETAEDQELVAAADRHYFYSGPLPALRNPKVVVSINGHTVRVTGALPAGVALPELPHVRRGADGLVNVVYPIATGLDPANNSVAGNYKFEVAKPYRPSGTATNSSGTGFVPWGGFPFLGYNNGVAFHGPITVEPLKSGGTDVWFLRRGAVSHGCNRMNGEHAVELTHILGLPMRKIYPGNTPVTVPTSMRNATVTVIADYDLLDGKYIDIDYPTDVGAVRPATKFGSDKVTMFGSWVATEAADGKDLPANKKWEGGVAGDYYVFAEHAKRGWVCSAPKSSFAALTSLATKLGGLLPADFCTTSDCYLKAAQAGTDPAACKSASAL